MELQHIRSSLTAKLLEPMIRLTALKAHEMCQGVFDALCSYCAAEHSTQFVAECVQCADKDYQSALVMDRKELAKMFLSLKALYTAHRQMGQKLSTEAEFTSYLVLLKVRLRMHPRSLSLSETQASISMQICIGCLKYACCCCSTGA